MNIRKITVGKLETNCYLVRDNDSETALLIDPGADADRIIKFLDDLKVAPTEIVLTHSHYDHIAAAPVLKERFGIPISIHEIDAGNLKDPAENFSVVFGEPIGFEADNTFAENHKWKIGNSELTVLLTPGHTPGSISLITSAFVLSGDTIFKSGIGRTDIPGGDHDALVRSIKRLLGLGDETIVYPGHGPNTTIGKERLFLTGL